MMRLTSQTTTIVADSSFDRRDIYVALSRAKERSVLVVDRNALDLAIRADDGFERTADEISAEERREHLVRQMSRWRAKSSTLEFLPDPACTAAHGLHPNAQRERRRQAAVLDAEAELSP